MQQWIQTPILIAENIFDGDKLYEILQMPLQGNETEILAYQAYVLSLPPPTASETAATTHF
jgi:hypothetical protein